MLNPLIASAVIATVVLAQTSPTPAGPPTDITALWGYLTQMGAAGAAMGVAWLAFQDRKSNRETLEALAKSFLSKLDDKDERHRQAIERLESRTAEIQDQSQKHTERLIEGQNSILRDFVVTMKSLEKAVDNSTKTIASIEDSLHSLQIEVTAMNVIVRHTAVSGRDPAPVLPKPPGPRPQIEVEPLEP